MELIQETKNDKKNEGGVTLRDIVELVFDNWYWIVLSVVICMSVAWFYLAMQKINGLAKAEIGVINTFRASAYIVTQMQLSY